MKSGRRSAGLAMGGVDETISNRERADGITWHLAANISENQRKHIIAS
jgi:hypothetical protein